MATAKNVQLMTLASKDFSKEIVNFAVHIKLLSIVGVPISLGDLATTVKKILSGLFARDAEAVVLAGMSFTIISADIIDSVTTFFNAASVLLTGGVIELFSAMGLPLAVIMSTTGIVSRTIQIAKSINLYRNINNEICESKALDRQLMKTFLENTLMITEELKGLSTIPMDRLSQKQKERLAHLKDKNKAAILRTAPADAAKDLGTLMEILGNDSEGSIISDEDQSKILRLFQNIQNHLLKSVKANAAGIFANLLVLTALILFSFSATTPAAPFVLLATAIAVRLAVVIYQNQKIEPIIK